MPNPETTNETLPPGWEPSAHEDEIYRRWQDSGLFTADPASEKPKFSIVVPPPNVTGNLHVGHAMEHAVMDAICRRKRMQGYEVLYLPGFDHASIATQAAIDKQLAEEGTSRHELGREAFLERAFAWKEQVRGNISGQMRRLGDSVDWSRERFTMDEGMVKAVRTVFKQLFDAGLIYQAERLVNWSPKQRTVISDAEVIHKEVDGELVSLRYGSLKDDEPHIVVATTRVETMLGDVAVAVHPDDERYRHLVGTTLPHPLVERELRIVADAHVDPEFGTGAVKITPAHDPNDFELAQRHGLAMLTVMDEDGKIAGTGTRFDGMDRFEARKAVRLELADQGRVVAEVRPYKHSVGHSERGGEPVEPRLSLQWFLKVEPLAKAAGEQVRSGAMPIAPEGLVPRWFEWTDNMRDWCVSRQLWWGHRIPVWYGPEGEVRCFGPGEEIPDGWRQEEDVLDTWFSSGLWAFATLGWPEKTPELEAFYPVSVLVTGYDILFFWAVRMAMFGGWVGQTGQSATATSAQGLAQAPFRELWFHGLVRDEKGQKMSKSKGNVINPLDWLDRFGADATRFALLRAVAPGADVPMGESNAIAARNFVTKLFNATRFALISGAAEGFGAELAQQSLTDADRWILGRLEEVRAEADSALEAGEFAKASQALYQFTWDEFCDWYLELAKLQMPGRADSTRAVLARVLDTLLRLLHPIMPFVTDVLWRSLTGGETLASAPWPEPLAHRADPAVLARVAAAQTLITDIRRFRSEQGLPPGQRIPAALDGLAEAGIAGWEEQIRAFAKVAAPAEDFNQTAAVESALGSGVVVVRFDLSGAVDKDALRKRLEKDVAAQQKERDGTEAKLSDESFLAKAPEHVVEKIRARHETAKAEIERLEAKLKELL
ncbi:valine--tRNA ligase [Segniliparus rugosus]|uniref:Valine--tRNA ligase n=1 Tax=Segniliparus rugosus (strain ATCC BAA-974 / DSM 45345 / CCUG 50838 / CIP 108380 / JCM 13579 / CDC 945) TaxID=679197 RepID=E5XNY2_SEGRC|nr:valine--tRNA ligase [Segniliparus rugosus]EFV13951.1 valine-tRNA ligase [Segniliparus rugosus ATCC BAA-974]